MNKSVTQTYNGMQQDLTKSKFSNNFYFEGKNIRIVTTDSQSTNSVTNEKGNSLILTIPTPVINYTTKVITYGLDTLSYTTDEINTMYFISGILYEQSQEQFIVGHCTIRNNIILFTTDNNGFDCIWKVNDTTYDIELLYLRNLGFNVNNPIQCVNNYENEIIDKIYWVDSIHQTRFLNIYNSIQNLDAENLIDLSINNIQFVGTFNLDQPEIIDVLQGSIHTAGVIQYAYNLYRINGTQTKISPLSEQVALDKGTNSGGGDVNEIVGSLPVIKIDNIDPTYTNIRLYAVKYTSFNETPEISLILDRSISDVTEVIYYDDGNIINTISLEEFLFLGSDIIIPKHINTKFNRLFFANYKENNFDVNTYNEVNSIDTRAYSFPTSTTTVNVYNSLYDNAGVLDSLEAPITIDADVISGVTTVPYDNSTININYDVNNKQFNSTIVGGEGAYLKYKILRNQIGDFDFTVEDTENKFLKDNEIYRLGIQFYNKYGQNSLPKWIADFKTIVVGNQSNLNGYYASVELTLKSSFYTWLADNNNFLDENGNYDDALKPVGYKLLRAERTLLDKTIICQGLINGTLSQIIGDDTGDNEEDPLETDYINRVNAGLKIPSMMRRFDEYLFPMWRNKSYFRVDRFDEAHPEFANNTLPGSVNDDAGNEVYKAEESGQWTAGTYQFNKLMQLFSPEVTFNSLQSLGDCTLVNIGGLENDYNAAWEQVRQVETKQVTTEAKSFNTISPHDIKAYDPGNFELTFGERDQIQFHGFFGHGQEGEMNFVQAYRRYTGDFSNSSTLNTYKDIYGTPVISEKGQGRTTYNNDGDMVFYNSLENLSADMILNSVNTWGAKNITFALGDDALDTEDREGIEDLYTSSGIIDTGTGLICEFRIPKLLVYLGNIYGGNSYESKKRTNYIEIGQYNNINENVYNCKHAGDTFISNFKFTKLVKTDTETYSRSSFQFTEIVEFRVETTVDLKNRHDVSLEEWDARFQPRYEEYQKYNKVYSQEPTLILRRDLDYKFKRVDSFDTNVICSKLKSPGEIIDNWTDIEVNNVLTLKGQYGPINCLHSYKDELYTLQDTGFALLSINPRVQVQGDDGLALQLGTGQVLDRYQYISTESGTLNKWSVVSSPSTLYYYDTLNKSLNSFTGGLKGLSDEKGMHIYFTNNTVLNDLKIDNPLIGNGVSAGYDYINNELFMSFHQDNPFTICYNESKQYFTSFYDYIPNRYISKGHYLITTNPTNNSIYLQYAGDYNTFYGVKYPSSIIFNVNPEPTKDCVFNNINFKSDVTLNGLDQVDRTLTHIQAYNDYQDSTLIPLILGRNNNLRRKFRDWNALIPRQSRNRIRAPYMKLKVQFTNLDNLKLILHDLNIYYTTY